MNSLYFVVFVSCPTLKVQFFLSKFGNESFMMFLKLQLNKNSHFFANNNIIYFI